jgi:hypothetical protein
MRMHWRPGDDEAKRRDIFHAAFLAIGVTIILFVLAQFLLSAWE